MKKGFTLVELSIVLVIIGLLIGGILAGQSLVTTAKVSDQVRQIQQVGIAITTFKERYKALPGDASFFGGNNNGAITNSVGAVDSYNGEMGGVWSQLFPGKYPDVTTGDVLKPGTNVPTAKSGKKGAILMIAAKAQPGTYNLDTTDIENFIGIVIHYSDRMSATVANGRTMEASMLLAIDKKIDDGAANAGNVIAGSVGAVHPDNGGIGAMELTEYTDCSSGANYVVTASSYECTPLFKINKDY